MPQESVRPSQVAIALSRAPRALPDNVLVLFVPSDNTWNDFGFRVHADVGIRGSPGDFEWVNGYLAFKDEEDSRIFTQKLLDVAKAQWIPIEAVQSPFASMLRNIKAYQQLVRVLGIQNAQEVATIARDVAFAHARNRAPLGWPDFVGSPVFNRALMRIGEAAFAYENASAVFAGQTLDAEDARQDFTGTVKLGNASLIFRFQFPEGGLTEDRLSVIIGRNGTGKTASLIALGRKLLDRNARGAVIEPRPLFNQVLVYAHSRSLRRFKIPARNPRAASQKTFSLDPTKTAASQSELTTQLAAMARESDYLDNPLQTLVDVVAAEFHGISIWVPVTEQHRRQGILRPNGWYAPLEGFRGGAEQARLDGVGQIDTTRPLLFLGPDKEPRMLSLGQDVFISFAFHAIGKSGPASIFLVDEPENFLHPNLTSRFVRLLHSILQRTKSIAIVATHSPYVVREVQRSQVHVLSSGAKSSETVVDNPRLQTFGANVSSISDHIFGDDIVEHLHTQLLRQAELQELPVEDWLDKFKDQLSLDALMLLRQQREKKQEDNT